MLGIEIHGSLAEKYLSVNLKDVLGCFSNIHQVANWRLYSLDTLAISETPTINKLEAAVDASSDGIIISSSDILSISDEAFQIIDLILLGGSKMPILHIDKNYRKTKENCDYYIELFDSSYFIVYTNDMIFLNCLKFKYDGIREIED